MNASRRRRIRDIIKQLDGIERELRELHRNESAAALTRIDQDNVPALALWEAHTNHLDMLRRVLEAASAPCEVDATALWTKIIDQGIVARNDLALYREISRRR